MKQEVGAKENKDWSLSSSVDLESYTSSSNLYSFPNDGYVELTVNKGAGVSRTAYLYGNASTTNYARIRASAPNTNLGGMTSLFVKKGMKTYYTGDAGTYYFYPLV